MKNILLNNETTLEEKANFISSVKISENGWDIKNNQGVLFSMQRDTTIQDVLNEMEKNELYLKYNIENDKQLPQISRFDPVSKAILLRPGEVCKIIRHDKISLQNDYYRICVG